MGENRAGFSYLWDWHFLGCAGVSHAGEKGPSEHPAEGGSGDYPLAQTGEKGKGEEGIKENSNPCLWNQFEQKCCSFFHRNDTFWSQVGYFELGRCPEEHFGESLRRKNICVYPSAKGMNQLEGRQDTPEMKGWTLPWQKRSRSGNYLCFLGCKACFHSRGKKTSLQLLRSIHPRERKTRHPLLFTPRNNVLVKYHNTRKNWEVTGSHLGKQEAPLPLQFFSPQKEGRKHTFFSPSHSPAE